MELSLRAIGMPSSPIRKLVPFADEAKRRGIHVYHLNIGQPDIKTPECALDALRKIDRSILEYSPSDGCLSLRTRLAGYYAGFGINLGPDEIIITTGGSEAVLIAFMTCLNPGDEIIVTDPFYANYKSFAIFAGAVIKSVRTSIEEGFRLPSVEAFEEQITPRTKAIVINTPSNPSGKIIPQDKLKALAELAIKNDLVVIADEVYKCLIYDKKPFRSIVAIDGMRERTLLINSLSKEFCMTGYRLGYSVGPKELIAAMTKLQENVAACAPLPSQYAGIEALSGKADYSARMVEIFTERRNLLYQGLKDIPQIRPILPEATFYMMVDISATGMTSLEFAHSLLKEAKVALVPGIAYGKSCDRYVRIAFTIDKARIEEGIRRIKSYFERR